MSRKKASDKVLRDKAISIAKTSKFDWYQRRLASKVSKFSDKTSADANTFGGAIKINVY